MKLIKAGTRNPRDWNSKEQCVHCNALYELYPSDVKYYPKAFQEGVFYWNCVGCRGMTVIDDFWKIPRIVRDEAKGDRVL